MRRPESRIAVVSHCGFIFLTLSAFGHECAHSVQEEMHRGFDNCEMRSMVRGGRGLLDVFLVCSRKSYLLYCQLCFYPGLSCLLRH